MSSIWGTGHVPGGTYGALPTRVCADQDKFIAEVDEHNNCAPGPTLSIVQPPRAPTGRLITRSCSGFYGESSDPDSGTLLWHHIYRDGVYVGATQTNASTGKFWWPYPLASKTGRTYRWDIYALDDRVNGHAGNPRISQFTQRCSNNPPTGSFVHADRSGFYGWAYDPDSNITDVHIYASGQFIAAGKANKYDAKYGARKGNAFGIALPASKRHLVCKGYPVEVKAYAINLPSGQGGNRLFGRLQPNCR